LPREIEQPIIRGEQVKVAHEKSVYTAAIQRDGKWWIGWIEEVSGVNAQARTRRELLSDLRVALKEALEINRSEARAATHGAYEEIRISV
jgi:predicted RNase H-like HicB family nuclease